MKFNRGLIVILAGLMLYSTGCAKHSQNFYFGDYSEAEKHFSKGDYQQAIESYQSYIDENPEGNLAVIAEYYIAKSHEALGQIDQAKAFYNKIIKENPDLVWANFSKTRLKDLES